MASTDTLILVRINKVLVMIVYICFVDVFAINFKCFCFYRAASTIIARPNSIVIYKMCVSKVYKSMVGILF